MADQIILMQPVHDQHDRTFLLVVEPAVEGVVELFVDRLSLGLRQGLLGLQRIVEDDDFGATPVSTPPNEVASRQPCWVVSHSGMACRWAEKRVGKAR